MGPNGFFLSILWRFNLSRSFWDFYFKCALPNGLDNEQLKSSSFITSSSNANCKANCSVDIPALREDSALATFMVILIWDDKLKHPEIRQNEMPTQSRIVNDKVDCVVRCDGAGCTRVLSELQLQLKKQQSCKS